LAREIFVDTGAWIAISDSRDQYHFKAKSAFGSILSQYQQLVTTNLVIAETYTLIRYRGGYLPAMNFLKMIKQSKQILRIYAEANMDNQAETILQRYADQDFSLTDAVSFAIMRERGIKEVFGFDHHFLIIGFVLVPGAKSQ